jgi:hypothetical protein
MMPAAPMTVDGYQAHVLLLAIFTPIAITLEAAHRQARAVKKRDNAKSQIVLIDIRILAHGLMASQHRYDAHACIRKRGFVADVKPLLVSFTCRCRILHLIPFTSAALLTRRFAYWKV